ncbi:MAG: YybH family protein [bacterium]
MKSAILYCFVMVAMVTVACGKSEKLNETAIKSAIETVMKQQVEGWNEGSPEKFMAGYEKSETLRYVSGGHVAFGWQTLLERYKQGYPDKAAMGKLSFTETDITVLAANAALVFGKWALQRKQDQPWGYFTLLFRKTEAGWRIVHDHTSSAQEK